MDTRAAFDLLWDADQRGTTIDALPEELRPTTRAEAYDIQAHWGEVTTDVPGWKIAATAEAGQRHINVDGPLPGRVLAERVHSPGAVPLAGNLMHLAELEYAFTLTRDLPPRPEPYAATEVLDAVGDLLLSVELPSSRFTDVTAAGTAQLIADNACGHRLVLSSPVTADWRALDLAAQPLTLTNSNGTVHRGSGAAVLGHPITALTWLVNELSAHGITLRAGQFVTTGVCTEPQPVAAGETIVGDYGPLGMIEVTFTE